VQKVHFRDLALVASVEVPLQMIDLTLNQLRLNVQEQVAEFSMCHLLFRAVRLCLLVEISLRVNLALDQDLLHLLDHLFSVDACKFIHELVKADITAIVDVELSEDRRALIFIKLHVHGSHLLLELWVANLTIGVGVYNCKHHSNVQVLSQNVLFNLVLSRNVLELVVCAVLVYTRLHVDR